ncbi:MAG: dipicolinate synthase subunit B [Oscillospiraceae bacterium]
MTDFKGIRIVYAMTGSFCTFSKAFRQMENLIALGADIQPLMSFNASTIDTRFGKASEHIAYAEKLSGKKVITDISGAEPIGPKHMADIVLVAPCTGNTLAKIANNIVDTSVTMAVKSHLRNSGAVVLCIATNDGLAGSAKNIGKIMNNKNIYFVPFRQDDYVNKPSSLVADFSLIPDTIESALQKKQIQPILRQGAASGS